MHANRDDINLVAVAGGAPRKARKGNEGIGRLSEAIARFHSRVRMKRARKRRPRIEDRTNTNEAKKPWLKLEMSGRTWYRRRAERRARGSI
jgi:hypothetical protein